MALCPISRLMSSLELYLLVSILLTVNSAETPFPVFAVSEKSPIAVAIVRNSSARNAFGKLLVHFSEVEGAVRRSISCTRSFNVSWFTPEAQVRFPSGAPNTSSCIAEMQLPNQGPLVWNAIADLQETLAVHGKAITEELNLDWDELHSKATHNPFSDEDCAMHIISGFRVLDRWMLILKIISTSRQASRFSGEVLTEYVYGPEKSLERPINRLDGTMMARATTTLWKANDSFQCCSEDFYRPLLLRHKKWLMHSTETLGASNIATMMLPLVLSLVPIALFVDAGKLPGFIYALVTNVMNILPLAFKGAELVYQSRNAPISTNTAAFGLDSASTIGSATTWVLKCELSKKLNIIGIAFILVSLLTMILGLYLEVRARRTLETQKLGWKLTGLNENYRMLFSNWHCGCSCHTYEFMKSGV